ncbi:MAG: LamG domain-containing protein, partial [Candidatus Limnocylindria bacterium]
MSTALLASLLIVVAPPARVAAAAGNGLQFNGSSQYVTFGAATGASGLTAATFTLELWFERTGPGAGTTTGSGGITSAIPLLTKGRAESETPANVNMNYFLGLDAGTGQLVADFEDTTNGGNHPVTGTAVVSQNVWHHAAATFGAGTWNLYLDGVLDKTLSVGAFTPEATSIQHAALGTAMTSTGVAAGFFQGMVDEPRIWNVVRTAAQISANKGLELTSGTGLIGRWG